VTELPLGLKPPRPPRRKPATAPAEVQPVARVVVDTGLAHLDRPFDYLVP
jgi:primosomal protein N' (replication factor Y) (superfamily II helicase)